MDHPWEFQLRRLQMMHSVYKFSVAHNHIRSHIDLATRLVLSYVNAGIFRRGADFEITFPYPLERRNEFRSLNKKTVEYFTSFDMKEELKNSSYEYQLWKIQSFLEALTSLIEINEGHIEEKLKSLWNKYYLTFTETVCRYAYHRRNVVL